MAYISIKNTIIHQEWSGKHRYVFNKFFILNKKYQIRRKKAEKEHIFKINLQIKQLA